MSAENEACYKWALECFKLIFDKNVHPNLFVTDRELALMNAIQYVFPEAKNLLCQVHIHRNILANCRNFFTHGKECDVFLGIWQLVVNSSTENEFQKQFNQLLSTYSSKYPAVVEYVKILGLNHIRKCLFQLGLISFYI
ncbi:hypothetical protein KSP39_PZI021954 [Platanthera zijinensis]|uniref:MULE transposase domain-containing protein n=1 Tax=Platanthera zijinensis TaxID=2320716 RepID=A0AAP0AX17_9ASPA